MPPQLIDLCDLSQLSDRQAMLLPETFVETPIDNIEAEVTSQWERSEEEIISSVESRSIGIRKRFAAGTILGLRGDPRIDPLCPKMVEIPEGVAQIGLDEGKVGGVVRQYTQVGVQEKWILKECPNFSTTVLAFRLGKYPVTNLEYRLFLQENKARAIPSSWPLGKYPIERSNHPVYSVTPEDAEAYTLWLNLKTGRNYRLPTEVEWEYAASSGDGREFPWGDHFIAENANTLELGLLTTTPVGMFAQGASSFGIMDMAGNVEEYVADDYWVYPGGVRQEDHLNQSDQNYRIARGGSFTRFADLARCKRRHGRFDRNVFPLGFRLAESICR